MRAPILLLTILLLGAACNGGLTGPSTDGLSIALAQRTAEAGGQVEFTLRNASRATATTGLLDCVATFEQEVDGEWRGYATLRLCPAVAQMHEGRSSTDATTDAPLANGTYRLVVEAWYHNPPADGPIVVRSVSFTVTSAEEAPASE